MHVLVKVVLNLSQLANGALPGLHYFSLAIRLQDFYLNGREEIFHCFFLPSDVPLFDFFQIPDSFSPQAVPFLKGILCINFRVLRFDRELTDFFIAERFEGVLEFNVITDL